MIESENISKADEQCAKDEHKGIPTYKAIKKCKKVQC